MVDEHPAPAEGCSMTGEELALAACAVFAGLWSGLLAMLTLIMHPMPEAMDGSDVARFLRALLPVARRSWFNYVCVFGLVLAPVAARSGRAGRISSPAGGDGGTRRGRAAQAGSHQFQRPSRATRAGTSRARSTVASSRMPAPSAV